MDRGEVHHYYDNGLYAFERDLQNKGMIRKLEYCTKHNLFTDNPVCKLSYWVQGLPSWMDISLLMRRCNLTDDKLKQINEDEIIRNALDRLYGDKVKKIKYHWKAMEVAQDD